MMFRKPTQTRRKPRLVVQPLECRRVLAASLGWDGPGLGSAELSYYVANTPNSLTQAETNAAIATALNAWSSAADITFTPTGQPGLRDSIDISFVNIDGIGGTLAQAYFPDDVNQTRIAGDAQFDISEAWEIGNSLGSRAFDLVYVAVHEIGHSLGLDHTGVLRSVLAPFVSPNQAFNSLPAVDVSAIQDLYAAASGTTTIQTPVDETPVDETPVDETPATDTTDNDSNPFPRQRWHRGGSWNRFGGRLDAENLSQNYINPTDVNGDGSTSALDAMMIVNQLNILSSTDGTIDTETAGLCDANGDGNISALDALTVINSLNVASLAPITTVGENETDVADTVDLVDEIDETDDTDLEDSDDVNCHSDRHHDTGVFNVGLFGKDAESLITRYDTDDDAALSQTEVSSRLWDKFTALDVDSNGDGLVALDELNAAKLVARQSAFAEKDTDADGLLTEAEVTARFWAKITAADVNADGGVSFDELDSLFTQQETEQVGTGGRLHHHHNANDEVFAQLGSERTPRSRGRR